MGIQEGGLKVDHDLVFLQVALEHRLSQINRCCGRLPLDQFDCQLTLAAVQLANGPVAAAP